MKTTFKIILATLVISLSASSAVFAADAKKPAKEAEKPAAKEKEKPAEKEEGAVKKTTYPLYGQVVSVNNSTLTIKGGEGKEDRKFSVNADTILMKGDKPATIEDIKEGQWVGGSIDKAAEGHDKVLKLNLNVKQKAAKPEAKEVVKTETKEETKPKATKKKES